MGPLFPEPWQKWEMEQHQMFFFSGLPAGYIPTEFSKSKIAFFNKPFVSLSPASQK